MQLQTAFYLAILTFSFDSASAASYRSRSSGQDFGDELGDLVGNVRVTNDEGEVIIDKTYDPKVTAIEALIDVKAAMESHFELVTDEHLEEVDPNKFVMSINGLVQDNAISAAEDRLEIPIKIPLRKWGVVITIDINIGISPLPQTTEGNEPGQEG